MSKKMLINFLLTFVFLLSAGSALAHVTVKPSEVGIGKFQTFTVGVPVEKEMATVGLRLVIPEGLNHVSPNLKPGWSIELKRSGGGEETKITEILWTGGNIPAGFRDEFLFSARVPIEETKLIWKAFQIYQDGSTVAWDLDPETSKDQDDFSKSGPYSLTKVIDDLAGQKSATREKSEIKLYKLLTITALIISLVALALQLRKKKK